MLSLSTYIHICLIYISATSVRPYGNENNVIISAILVADKYSIFYVPTDGVEWVCGSLFAQDEEQLLWHSVYWYEVFCVEKERRETRIARVFGIP